MTLKYQDTTKCNKTKKYHDTYNTMTLKNSTTKKSHTRETKHLSTNADSSTDTAVLYHSRVDTQKPDFLKRNKSSKTQKLKMSRNMPKLVICPLTRGF